MLKESLVDEEELESKVLREAAEILNFVWLLARTYRAPELIEFLKVVRSGLRTLPDPPRKRLTRSS